MESSTLVSQPPVEEGEGVGGETSFGNSKSEKEEKCMSEGPEWLEVSRGFEANHEK